MKYTITALGGTGRPVGRIAGDVVDYLLPGRSQRPLGERPESANRTGAEPVRYYADSGEAGTWSGRGALALGLSGEVAAADFAKVLAGRDPGTGARLISAQGSAGRRPKLGVGTETGRSASGEAVYDARDAAAVLGLDEARVARMVEVGSMLALARLIGLAVRDQPAASYLVPVVDRDGVPWLTETELSRCEDALQAGTSAKEVAATGPPDELVSLDEAARLAGVTARYLRRLAKRHEAECDAADDPGRSEGRSPRRAHLAAVRGTRGHWFVARGELAAFVERRRPPAVRVGFDLTLTTEKSLGVLALLSDGHTRDAALDAISSGNAWAMGWLERNGATARARGRVVTVKGWAVASFQHHTSRALDPFPHVHNVVANSAEDSEGVRRALDARPLYRNARAASALATAEMRYQLTRRLGVQWRPTAHGGWEVAGIPENVLDEFSQRAHEIDDALAELEQAIGRGARPGEIDRVKTATRPAKTHVPLPDLLPGWWERAAAIGFDPDGLASCVAGPVEPPEPDLEQLHALLAAPDGICANLSVFTRGDVLARMANQPIPRTDGSGSQPLIASAERLEQIADAFLTSSYVEQLTPETDTAPARYSTREMLAVQDRVMARYRHGRCRGAALVSPGVVEGILAAHPWLTGEQRALVRSFCTSGHRTQLALGHPGAGKTTAMAAAREAWREAGWRVLGAAVKGEAARILGVTAEIPSETLAWYLAHEDPLHSPLDSRTVLVVDEASTISDRDLDRLGWLADLTGASLRLIGDPAQHGAVEAGGMFRVLCERHEADVPQLTMSHRLEDAHDVAAASLLRTGDAAAALGELDAAGHLHIVEDEYAAYAAMLGRWWDSARAGEHHPMVSRRNEVRRTLNRLAHQLRRAAGEIGTEEMAAAGGRRYSIGDRVIARLPHRRLHPTGEPGAYVRNGALGTVTGLRHGARPGDDHLLIDFDGLGTVTVPRSFFDEHAVDRSGRREAGIDHAYAVTSYAVTGATHPVSTSRIDESSSRAEAYVDITRGRRANHLFLTPAGDDLDGEHLPRVPPDPIDDAVAERLATSNGEGTAWEVRQDAREAAARSGGPAIAL